MQCETATTPPTTEKLSKESTSVQKNGEKKQQAANGDVSPVDLHEESNGKSNGGGNDSGSGNAAVASSSLSLDNDADSETTTTDRAESSESREDNSSNGGDAVQANSLQSDPQKSAFMAPSKVEEFMPSSQQQSGVVSQPVYQQQQQQAGLDNELLKFNSVDYNGFRNGGNGSGSGSGTSQQQIQAAVGSRWNRLRWAKQLRPTTPGSQPNGNDGRLGASPNARTAHEQRRLPTAAAFRRYWRRRPPTIPATTKCATATVSVESSTTTSGLRRCGGIGMVAKSKQLVYGNASTSNGTGASSRYGHRLGRKFAAASNGRRRIRSSGSIASQK